MRHQTTDAWLNFLKRENGGLDIFVKTLIAGQYPLGIHTSFR